MELTKALTKERQDRIYKLYLTAFPESERKPFPLLIEKQEEGIVDILSIEEDDHFLGLAIMVRYLDMVLLDYLAIDESARNGGYGSLTLQALFEHYPDMRMILEIDSTKEETAADLGMRIRRKEFYHRNGLTDLPYEVNLWGNRMEMLSNGRPVRFEEYLAVYRESFGPAVTKNISLFAADSPESTGF